MNLTDDILLKEFEQIKIDLINLYDSKGMRASGKWADSLEVVGGSYEVSLMGLQYSQQLETGREAGGFPPIETIKKWILDKGVFAQALQTIKLSSLAFLIARKIARDGWKREQHGGVNLISEIITPERIQKIIDEVGVAETFTLTTEILGFITELEAA
jgi:hypothetical protein